MNRRALGKAYEEKAAAFLESRGYEILERNFSSPGGEIDLIARDGQYLVFVEVKYRATDRFGAPSQAVDARKQERIRKAAVHYMCSRGIAPDVPCRFDVVSILGGQVEIIENAF